MDILIFLVGGYEVNSDATSHLFFTVISLKILLVLNIDLQRLSHYSSGMNIIVNGDTQVVDDYCTAAQLVDIMGIKGGRIAMEVNREIVPRSSYDTHQFKADDVVEIVHAVGGG